jgi:hypothetical protein
VSELDPELLANVRKLALLLATRARSTLSALRHDSAMLLCRMFCFPFRSAGMSELDPELLAKSRKLALLLATCALRLT